jgi:uncharacterized protein YkwD
MRTVTRGSGVVWLSALCLTTLACRGTLVTFGDDDPVDARDDVSPGSTDARPGPLPPGVPDAGPGPGPNPIADAQPPPEPDASPGYDDLSLEEQQLFDTINEERVARGLGTVELRTDLNCAAARHSNDIGTLGWCGHTGSDGSSPGDRVFDCSGAGWSGEIVACGQSTPRSAVDAWIWSPGHASIMFSSGQRYIGVAMHNNYWTAIFDS